MVPESRLESTEHGLVPMGDGWFVLNVAYASFTLQKCAYEEGWLPD